MLLVLTHSSMVRFDREMRALTAATEKAEWMLLGLAVSAFFLVLFFGVLREATPVVAAAEAAAALLLLFLMAALELVGMGAARLRAPSATMITSARLIRGKFFFSRREKEDIFREKVGR